jgi:hypothetical protein
MVWRSGSRFLALFSARSASPGNIASSDCGGTCGLRQSVRACAPRRIQRGLLHQQCICPRALALAAACVRRLPSRRRESWAESFPDSGQEPVWLPAASARWRRNLDQAVERALPNYRETDRDPRWHRFLLEIDPYTGQVRQQLLNAAIARSDATAVIAFFKGFMREAGGAPTSSAAPGRARPASPANKIYTRDEIKQLYRAHQQGAYVGREAEWARLENDFYRAQREGARARWSRCTRQVALRPIGLDGLGLTARFTSTDAIACSSSFLRFLNVSFSRLLVDQP